MIKKFPPIEQADEHGILAIGGDLEPQSLLLAYSNGIFPWPWDEENLLWFAPPQRTILFLDKIHISKSLLKEKKRRRYTYAINKNFTQVIRTCAELQNRGNQKSTWITNSMIAAYSELHRLGFCHSIETYENESLVGGLYGVSLGNMFAGESMFYRKGNASKLALCFLVEHLLQRGAKWIDCQVMTPVFKDFGAKEIPRQDFMQLLREALQTKVNLFDQS